MLFLLLVCTASGGPGAADDTAEPDPVDPNAYLKGTAALAEVSGGTCPTLAGSGNVDLVSNGKARTVHLIVPASGGEGKPVVFAWHPLGANARWLITALELEDYAESADVVVVVPSAADDQPSEW